MTNTQTDRPRNFKACVCISHMHCMLVMRPEMRMDFRDISKGKSSDGTVERAATVHFVWDMAAGYEFKHACEIGGKVGYQISKLLNLWPSSKLHQ